MRQDRQRTLRDVSDSALIDAMRDGVSEAWQEFLVRFRPLLMQYGLRTKMGRSDANDCVEHVLEDAAMRWAVDGAAPPKNIVAYLLRAASLHRRTLERDATRRERKHQLAIDEEQCDGAIVSASSEAAIRDSRGPADRVEEFTQDALARLCNLVRQSLREDDSKILMQLADGLPHREIAAELGLSYEAGRKRIQRLCARVRDVVPIAVQRLSSADRVHVERLFRRFHGVTSRGLDDAV